MGVMKGIIAHLGLEEVKYTGLNASNMLLG